MIRLIEVSRYRCLRYVRQEVDPFQILVGANASGKSTFLDSIAFLSDLLVGGHHAAILTRTQTFRDLVFMHEGNKLEIAVEADIPAERLEKLPTNGIRRARYEVAIGLNPQGELTVLGEILWLKPVGVSTSPVQRELFPSPGEPPANLVLPEDHKSPTGWRRVLTKKSESGNDYFNSETTGWKMPFRLGPQKLALANLPEDEERFPVATWFKRMIMDGVQRVVLHSERMRQASPPEAAREFQPDGSNLPYAVEALKAQPERFRRWIGHVRTALPDLETVDTDEFPDTRKRYLLARYKGGLVAPSWSMSDGTLRLLALTLVAYLDMPGRIFLIEEPENGIHPQAVETVYQSLSSAREVQVLCATHSPVILSLASPRHVLCFAKTRDGASDIIRGSAHPRLRDWQGEVDLGTLFATGVLG